MLLKTAMKMKTSIKNVPCNKIERCHLYFTVETQQTCIHVSLFDTLLVLHKQFSKQ